MAMLTAGAPGRSGSVRKQWGLVADGGTMMVTLYQDGSFYDQFPIE